MHLPFGMSSAPGIFQRVMKGVLRKVVVHLDDIVITFADIRAGLDSFTQCWLESEAVKVPLSSSVKYLVRWKPYRDAPVRKSFQN